MEQEPLGEVLIFKQAQHQMSQCLKQAIHLEALIQLRTLLVFQQDSLIKTLNYQGGFQG